MKKVYTLSAIVGLVLIVLAFSADFGTLDVHVHDTYFVIGSAHVLCSMGVLMVFNSILSFLLQRQLTNWFTKVITIGNSITISSLAILFMIDATPRYVDLRVSGFSTFLEALSSVSLNIFLLTQIILILMFIFLGIQILFVRLKSA